MELEAILVVGQENLEAHEVQEVPKGHWVQKERQEHQRKKSLAKMDN